jgi:lysine-specific demethylase/histidyl-hydroxylase NO66
MDEEWKGLARKVSKDRGLRSTLAELGLLDDATPTVAETLHNILDAIKCGQLSTNKRRRVPDYESCSSSDDEDDGDQFASYGDDVQQYDYDGHLITRKFDSVPGDPEAKERISWCHENPYAWSERTGMGRMLVTGMQEFFEGYFEKRPLHETFAGDASSRFSDLLSEDALFELISKKKLRYGLDVDVTIVGEDGIRRTLNGEGTANVDTVKGKFRRGCSVRLLHPQRFSDSLWSLMYRLECYWGSCVGCNAYLTPKGSNQGFAPHFDDIDAFILQVSGKKKWKLYRAPEDSLVLPRYSSRDFAAGELGKPFWNGTLRAGDVLYLPRGMIHEASSVKGSNSLHVTISVNQRNNYFEFLSSLLSDAVESCGKGSVAFRKTLPRNYVLPEYANRKEEFEQHIEHLLEGVFMRINPAIGVGKAFSDFMLSRLPPPPDTMRFPESRLGSKPRNSKINPGSLVSLTYPQSAYAELDVSGESPALFVYHCLSNSRDMHQTDSDEQGHDADLVLPQLEVPVDCGPALHTLLSGQVLSLGKDDMAGESMRVIELAEALVDAGILTIVDNLAN